MKVHVEAGCPSSPPMRGCSPRDLLLHIQQNVVPAHAGVLRTTSSTGTSTPRRPRPRGGAPGVYSLAEWRGPSSPPTRGCSVVGTEDREARQVVPAHAGVLPDRIRRHWRSRRRPRPRGGAPLSTIVNRAPVASSPPTQGCSAVSGQHNRRRDVVPAHAGVLPRGRTTRRSSLSRPRPRGGAPHAHGRHRHRSASSPPTRGCSGARRTTGGPQLVVPAHAGVLRRRASLPRRCPGRPRPRGGAPIHHAGTRAYRWSSPPTRGCSAR